MPLTADIRTAEHEPLTALARWFDRVADYARLKRGVLAAVEVAVWQDLSAHSHGPICDAVTTLLDAGKALGTIRDVILLVGYLSRLDEAEWDTRARHLLDIVLKWTTPTVAVGSVSDRRVAGFAPLMDAVFRKALTFSP